MNTLKTSLLAKSLLGASLVAAAVATPMASHAAAFGTPSGGMSCRSGYTPVFNGTNLKCTKTATIDVVLECNNPAYPNYLIRSVVGPTGVGRDFCLRNGFSLGSNDPLGTAVLGQPGRPGDYVLAEVNTTTVVTRTGNQDAAEATRLGIPVGDVDTIASAPVIQLAGGVGNKDNARVTLTHFTFPQAGSVVAGQTGPITGPAGPFVPRPLP